VRVIALLILLCTICISQERNEEWYRESYRKLARAAAASSLPELYYPTSTFTPPHWALMKIRDPVLQDVLVELFNGDRNERNKWNYLLIMINRQRHHNQPDSVDKVLSCCLGGVMAKDEWLKTESVWGVGFYGNESHIQIIEDARNDMSEFVADEANRTISKLRMRPLR